MNHFFEAKTLNLIESFCIVLLISNCASIEQKGYSNPEKNTAASKQIAPGVFLEGSYFFIGPLHTEGLSSSTPTESRIVHRGECFGTNIKVQSKKINLKMRAELHVPGNAKNFKYRGVPSSISKDQKMVTVSDIVDVSDDALTIFWGIDATDPLGKYQLKVFLEEIEVANYEFEVD